VPSARGSARSRSWSRGQRGPGRPPASLSRSRAGGPDVRRRPCRPVGPCSGWWRASSEPPSRSPGQVARRISSTARAHARGPPSAPQPSTGSLIRELLGGHRPSCSASTSTRMTTPPRYGPVLSSRTWRPGRRGIRSTGRRPPAPNSSRRRCARSMSYRPVRRCGRSPNSDWVRPAAGRRSPHSTTAGPRSTGVGWTTITGSARDGNSSCPHPGPTITRATPTSTHSFPLHRHRRHPSARRTYLPVPSGGAAGTLQADRTGAWTVLSRSTDPPLRHRPIRVHPRDPPAP
jgi:hypothetical protein